MTTSNGRHAAGKSRRELSTNTLRVASAASLTAVVATEA
jgi:hypothetical protein